MLHFLIVRPDRMGDAIISQVAIEALANTVDCEIDVFASDYSYSFYVGNPFVKNIYHCNTEDKKKMFKYYKSVCAKKEYTAIFVLQPRRRLQQMVLQGKCKNRFSFYLVYDYRVSSRIFEWTAATFDNFSFIHFDTKIHEVQNIKNLLNHGLNKLNLPPLAPLPVQCKLYSPEIYKANRVSNSIIINISGKPDEQKVILPSMLNALLLLLINESSKIGIVALADDKNIVESILQMVNKQVAGFNLEKIEVISSKDIFTVANSINNYEYYIGADGGLLHVASSLGLKCVGLYNDSVKDIWHPWTTLQISLSAKLSYYISPVDVVNAVYRLGFTGKLFKDEIIEESND